MDAQTQKRPIGATVMSLLMGWLALAGFANAIVWRTAPLAFNEPLPPRLASIFEALHSPMLTVFALAYGGTALASSIGIWRQRPWMHRAFLSWSLVVVVMFLWMLTIFPHDMLLGGSPGAALFLLFTVAMLALLYRYVARLAERGRGAAL
jgi:hypothetical protein